MMHLPDGLKRARAAHLDLSVFTLIASTCMTYRHGRAEELLAQRGGKKTSDAHGMPVLPKCVNLPESDKAVQDCEEGDARHEADVLVGGAGDVRARADQS